MLGIVFRNFITLLSIGAFDTDGCCGAMSQFKWSQVLQLADTYGVTDFISLGILRMYERNAPLIPDNILKLAKGHITESIKDEEHYDFSQKYVKKFSNYFLNRKLNKIIFNEIHSIDTSVTSLVFLLKLIDTMNGFLTVDKNFRNIIDVGAYLRECGDKIDFIKMDGWLKSLKMKNMSNLMGSYLVILFGFSPDELPFMNAIDNGLYARVYKSVEKPAESEAASSDADIGREMRIRGIMSPVRRPNTHAMKYIAYCPLEVTSKIMGNVGKSLANVEE